MSTHAKNAQATPGDPRWAAVIARDRAADGKFVYAVSSTGVYCRPSCPARRARRENVSFYATATAAQSAGFRPCKRCRPELSPLADRQAAKIAPPSLAELAAHSGLSAYHLHRLFKAQTGLTPHAYARAQRAQRVRRELPYSASVTEAIYAAGYNSNGRFYAESAQLLGMTPSAYRAGGAHIQIRFAVGQCSLGAILVAQSARGVCAILLGDDPQTLVRDLQDRFPVADLVGGDIAFEQVVARVVGFVEAPGLGLALPLDVRGTAFQQRVWQELRRIPAGQTASYADIARRIGAPQAVRAVAGACAANALAVAIPCHRVVRSDGALSGYRWGVARKRLLLEREAES
jgi:AraC family transcriptional regulator of adaptative response/methylated-DNA-[protein]-cysteine methyltransferase